MKVLIAFCLILYYVKGVYSDDAQERKVDLEKEIINGENEECAKEYDIDFKVVFHEMKTNENSGPTRSMQCFAACLLKKNGLMNTDGSLTRKYNDSAGAQKCKNLTGRDECDAAYKIINCLREHQFLSTGEN
nr:odorant-binding protein 11 [Leptocybe invasa]